MADSNKKNEIATSFTVDAEKSGFVEMPSVTRLLNRKSMKLGQKIEKDSGNTEGGEADSLGPTLEAVSSEITPPSEEATLGGITLAPPPSAEPVLETVAAPASEPIAVSSAPSPAQDISISLESTESFELETSGRPDEPAQQATASIVPVLDLAQPAISSPAATPKGSAKPQAIKVQPASRKVDRGTSPPLVLWDAARLKAGADPLGQGVGILFSKGAYSALFLAILPTVPGSPVPHFLAKAAIAPAQSKQALWSGLKWDPKVAPDVWNLFVRNGLIELPPPGTQTVASSNRNMVRAAFGIENDEWLTIVRAGPANSCRGLIALISKSSILAATTETLPLLSTLPSATRAAA